MFKGFAVGRLVQDPVYREGTGDKAYKKAEFTIAINRVNEDKADFLNIEVWGEYAKVCANSLSKGRQVAVEGDIQIEPYTHEGEKRTKVILKNPDVQFLDKKKEDKNASEKASGDGDYPPF